MKILQAAVILAILALGIVSARGPRPCIPGKDAQVVVSDGRTLKTWSPNKCKPLTFRGYPASGNKKPDMLRYCHGLTFVKNKIGRTQLVSYDENSKTWQTVDMSQYSDLKKLRDYAVTCWGSKLLLVGGRVPVAGTNGKYIPQNSIWALDLNEYVNNRTRWEPLHGMKLAISAYGSCAVTTGDLLTVMSGQNEPRTWVKKVFVYSLPNGTSQQASQKMPDPVIDCNALDNEHVAAIGLKGRRQLQVYGINLQTAQVQAIEPSLNMTGSRQRQARVMYVEDENMISLAVVGGRPTSVYYYDDGSWTRSTNSNPPNGYVLGVIE